MTAMEPLFTLAGIKPNVLSKVETSLLEAELFVQVCNELKEVFRENYKNFFRLMKFSPLMEETMLENNFIRLVIEDILYTEEYTLEGIAHYTNTHEDIIQELASGLNTKPLASCFRKIIELHRNVKPELYQQIWLKLLSKVKQKPKFVDA